jgi:hypothetical protein
MTAADRHGRLSGYCGSHGGAIGMVGESTPNRQGAGRPPHEAGEGRGRDVDDAPRRRLSRSPTGSAEAVALQQVCRDAAAALTWGWPQMVRPVVSKLEKLEGDKPFLFGDLFVPRGLLR